MFPDKFVAGGIIAKLPPSWNNFATSLKHKRQEFSVADLIGTLDVEEKARPKDTRARVAEGASTAHMVDRSFPFRISLVLLMLKRRREQRTHVLELLRELLVPTWYTRRTSSPGASSAHMVHEKNFQPNQPQNNKNKSQGKGKFDAKNKPSHSTNFKKNPHNGKGYKPQFWYHRTKLIWLHLPAVS